MVPVLGGKSKKAIWPQADGKEEQWYLSAWRIAPFGRFWQARHPPRYAAFNQTSSPRFPPSSPRSIAWRRSLGREAYGEEVRLGLRAYVLAPSRATSCLTS